MHGPILLSLVEQGLEARCDRWLAAGSCNRGSILRQSLIGKHALIKLLEELILGVLLHLELLGETLSCGLFPRKLGLALPVLKLEALQLGL